MELVGSGLRDERHHTAVGVTEFGLEPVGVHRKFGQSFDRGSVGGDPGFLQRARRVHRDAVECRLIGRGLSTAERKAGIAASGLRFRSQRGQIEGAADRASHHERKRVNQFLVNGDAGLGVFGMELHGGRLHFDHLLRLPDLQAHIRAHTGCGVHAQAFEFGRPESFLLHLDVVASNSDAGSRVLADVVAGEIHDNIGRGVGDDYFGLGDNSATRIANGSRNCAALGLREDHAGAG